LAPLTPGVAESFFSTLRAQPPQVMPETGRVTVRALIPI
jgi:hypothetical protein